MRNQSKPTSAAPMAHWVLSTPSAKVARITIIPANHKQSDAISERYPLVRAQHKTQSVGEWL
jgi:hypothetical protein